MKQVFRHLGIAVAFTILVLSGHVYSQPSSYDISERELQSLIEALSDQDSKLYTLNSLPKINDYLALYHPLDQIIIKHLWLNHLSYQQVILPHHFKWLRSLKKDNSRVFSRFFEHPLKKVVVVDIARQARSVLKIISIKRLVDKIEVQWLSNSFDWKKWLTGEPESYVALVNWVSQQHKEIEGIKQSFIGNAIASILPDNKLLVILIEKSPSDNLYSLLWQRKVDEFTYQAIHDLPNHYNNQLVVNQLVAATQIKPLSSQAILSLATHYPLDVTAQKTIESALTDPEQQWFALMALNKMDAREFKMDLLLKTKQQQTLFAKSASKALERQIAATKSKE